MKILKWLAITPLALIALAFAIANRHETTVSFDPFGGNDIASPQVTVPLFVLLIISVLFGVILGSLATWITQGKNRRAARTARSEAERWHNEADLLRAQATNTSTPSQGGALVRPY